MAVGAGVVAAQPSKLQFPEKLDFVHVTDFDENGLIHYIATQGRQAPWVNPADAGWLRVVASSLMQDSVPVSAVVGREVLR